MAAMRPSTRIDVRGKRRMRRQPVHLEQLTQAGRGEHTESRYGVVIRAVN
jgi:hypothetical protein